MRGRVRALTYTARYKTTTLITNHLNMPARQSDTETTVTLPPKALINEKQLVQFPINRYLISVTDTRGHGVS